MAITAPIAGAYTGTWGGAALGYTRQGYRLSFTHLVERFEETDLYGKTLIEMIYQGAKMTIDTIARLYATVITAAAFWPWAATFGNVWASARPIAQLATANAAQALVLTSVANTSAAASPASLTASKTVVADQSLDIVFNSQARDIPLRWDVIATDSTGTGSLFSTT